MLKNHITTLFEYNYWANARILDQAEQVTVEQLAAPVPYSHQSLRETLLHALDAEWIWRARCQEGISPTNWPSKAAYPTLAAIRQRWSEEEQKMRLYLGGLVEEDFSQVVRYQTTSGVLYENVLSQILAHLVLHGMQHRSEAAAMLTQFGHSPGDIDLITFLREGGF